MRNTILMQPQFPYKGSPYIMFKVDDFKNSTRSPYFVKTRVTSEEWGQGMNEAEDCFWVIKSLPVALDVLGR